MVVEVRQEPLSAVARYSDIPIAFEVRSVLDVAPATELDSLGGFTLTERRLAAPYVKDYDAAEGQGPVQWAERFDTSGWGLFVAKVEDSPVGGAVVAVDTPGVTMLEGRRDLAVLWDIRVRAEARGQGVGSALFRASEKWAAASGCRQLKIETQNVNVAACRFYARQGCMLAAAHPRAYAEFPDEIQLLWYKDLVRTPA